MRIPSVPICVEKVAWTIIFEYFFMTYVSILSIVVPGSFLFKNFGFGDVSLLNFINSNKFLLVFFFSRVEACL